MISVKKGFLKRVAIPNMTKLIKQNHSIYIQWNDFIKILMGVKIFSLESGAYVCVVLDLSQYNNIKSE